MRAKTAPTSAVVHRSNGQFTPESDRLPKRRPRHILRFLAVIQNTEALPRMDRMRLPTRHALRVVPAQLLLDRASAQLLLRPRKARPIDQKPLPADATTNVAGLIRQLTNHLVQVHLSCEERSDQPKRKISPNSNFTARPPAPVRWCRTSKANMLVNIDYPDKQRVWGRPAHASQIHDSKQRKRAR
jgi:hypothetical protein